MRKSKKNAPLHEALRNLWKIRIMLEKSYTETCATWMAQRIESLIDHMQYGHALIAYHKQDGTFRLAKATLLPYKADFRRDYDITRVTSNSSLLGRGTAGMENLPAGKLPRMESRMLTINH